MQYLDGRLILSATDLSSFLACRHRTGLDMAAARGQLTKPVRNDPFVAALREKGQKHEQQFVGALRAGGLQVVDIGDPPGRHERTVAALESGADVIVQAALRGDEWLGYADILRRVEQPDAPSRFGPWSYEAYDTKLARETRGGTILQLALYSDLLAAIQGVEPERFHVVTPHDEPPEHLVHSYRVAEYAAYYRLVKARLLATASRDASEVQAEYYPEPVEHCEVCHWWARCNGRRRGDDHLSFVAHIGRGHRTELVAQDVPTLTAAATMTVPVTFKPTRGSADVYGRIGHQARVQHTQRTTGAPCVELLPVQDDDAARGEGPAGLRRLPAPSPGDIFLDLEGAKFAREGGREYLFGAWTVDGTYFSWWAFDDMEERGAFEAVMDFIVERLARYPDAHIYHFNHYEPTAFKRLMGRHVTRVEQMDEWLRSERFVDLYAVARQALRAGVESYSIKQLEQYYGFARDVDLREVSAHLQAVELALESNAAATLGEDILEAVEGYNRDDCRSTLELRDWLEAKRAEVEAGGTPVPRPETKPGEASEPVAELQQRAHDLRKRLLALVPPEAVDPTHVDHPLWLLAYLVDWHKREENAQWWEHYRLRDLSEEDLLDEREAVAGLEFVEQIGYKIGKAGKPTKSVIHRYRYPAQELEVSRKTKLKLHDNRTLGIVVDRDPLRRTLDIEQGPSMANTHPTAAFATDVVATKTLQESVMRLAGRVADACETLDSGDALACGVQLLHRRGPRLSVGSFEALPGETPAELAVRIVPALDRTVLAVQGPPGAGKTHAGAQMIRKLVKEGRRVGVTAGSHKVIRNLLDAVREQAEEAGETVRIAQRVGEVSDEGDGSRILELDDNPGALDALGSRRVAVLGGTAWLWARPEFASAVDVLFVDEAGQMSLANALAVSQAADSLVLLGDPQQLDQPQKGSHPDGVDVSALQHVIGEARTMPAEQGIFMDRTWRLAPAICDLTSELFYEGQLRPTAGLENQRLTGGGPFDGAGLWWVSVEHDGNRNWSLEEIDAVEVIVDQLIGRPGESSSACGWVDEHGVERHLTAGDIRIVAPFNAHVNRLSERLDGRGVLVGTVDKFQGQTCAIVIYSMATSRPEDAPRGMEFLYSLNRLNVATSRARCAAVVVASPRLLEPECRTPRQMQLANALCRFREVAQRPGLSRVPSSLNSARP